MAARLVMTLKTSEETDLNELQKFINTAKQYGLPMKTRISVDNDVRLSTMLPEKSHVVNGEKVKLKPKSRKQVKVEKQIEEHKSKPPEEKEGYVPPEGRTTQPKPKKIKCPVCNTRKPLVTVAGVKVIKPHVVQGDPCPGGGQQPGANRKGSASDSVKGEDE